MNITLSSVDENSYLIKENPRQYASVHHGFSQNNDPDKNPVPTPNMTDPIPHPINPGSTGMMTCIA